MANVKKFLFIDSDGQQKEQTSLDTLQVADGVSASDVVNKGQLDAVATAASGAVTAEETRALAAEALLQSNIDGVADDLSSEVSRATLAEQAIAADLASETTARQNADTSIRNDLSQDILTEKTRAEGVEASLAQDILSEQSRAQSAENDLQAQITQEIADRETAITSLSGTLSAAITAEEQARIAADGALGDRIDTEISDREAAITTVTGLIEDEETRALAAEGVLSSAISQEVSDRQAAVSAEQSRAEGAEGQLASDIAAEASARAAAVSAEQTRAEAAEAQLAADLTTETGARIAGDAATLADAKAYADQVVQAISFKTSVRVALPWQFDMGGTITLPADFASIAGPAGLEAGDRVLLINKDDGTTSVDEGIYVVNTAGTALVRAPDMAAGSDASGALVYVEEGTLGTTIPTAVPGTSFVCASMKGADIVGTSALDFAVFSRAEALSFGMGIEKQGLDVGLKLSGASFFSIDEDMALTAQLDPTHLGVVDGALTIQGALVDGAASSADALHIHKHAAVVKACGVSAGFVKPDCTSATWNSPAVMGLVEADAGSGQKVIVVAGLGGDALPSGALDGFSVGDVVYLGGVAGEFAAFADVPSGKYAVPVGRKSGSSELIVQIGGAPTLKA